MRLPHSLRDKMKAPLGILLPEGRAGRRDIMGHLGGDPYVITVGDRTTEKMIGFGLVPSLQIVDGMERRTARDPPKAAGSADVAVDNPPAEITAQSVDAIRRAFSMSPPVRILVSGEEDLLVLPVCVHAPEGSVVMYGQPNEGLVIARITPEIRNKAQGLLDLME